MNAPSERVVVAVASQPPDERELVALVEHAEGHQLDDMDEFDEWRPEPHHPAEGPRTRESVAALTADTVGLGISIARQLAPWVRLPPEAPAFVDALKYHPKLRHLVAAVSGTEQAETAVGSVARAF
ncbi:hypothetical protein [Streptomyces sp. NPDC001530]|uniref:hypothetical protein n=1 Tax=Streptomyces sp. NPDC001530 TaxID=3364582 RepID=UPI00369F2C4C